MGPDFENEWEQTPGDEIERRLAGYFQSPEPDPHFVARLEADLYRQGGRGVSIRYRLHPVLSGFARGMALGIVGAILLLVLGYTALRLLPAPSSEPNAVAVLPPTQTMESPWTPQALLPAPEEYAGEPAATSTPVEVEMDKDLRLTPVQETSEGEAILPPDTDTATETPAAGEVGAPERTELATPGGAGGEPPKIAAQESSTAPSSELVLEFHSLGEQLADPDQLEQGISPVPQSILDARTPMREASVPGEGELNRLLAPFGYQLDSGNLYFAESLALKNVRLFDFPWFDPDGSTFSLALERVGTERAFYLVRPEGILTVEPNSGEDGSLVLSVQEGEKEILQREYNIHPYGDLVALVSWDGHWAVELAQNEGGDIAINGQWLNEQNGYEESFGLHLLEGKPLFFFEQDGVVRLQYDGQVQPLVFDEVVHYSCCSAAPLDLQGNNQMVWFYARQGDTWYYVEAGPFPQE